MSINLIKKLISPFNSKAGVLSLLFVIAIALINIFKYSFAMDFAILSLIIMATINRRLIEFFKDWTAPLIIFYAYEGIRGQAYEISRFLGIQPGVSWLINAESKLFFFLDELPTIELQNYLHRFPAVQWYDYIFAFFYVSFFWFWLIAGYTLWIKNKPIFKKYIYSLGIMSLFNTIVFYIFLPTAPPWWASEYGILPETKRLMWVILSYKEEAGGFITTYDQNDFAAFPSHHVAWPFLACLFLVQAFGKKAAWTFVFPLMVAFATWYGAEHYVIDSIAGVIIAFIFYKLSNSRFIEKLLQSVIDSLRRK